MHQEPAFTEGVYKGLIRPRLIVNQDHEKLLPFRSPTLCAAGWEVFHYRGCMVDEKMQQLSRSGHCLYADALHPGVTRLSEVDAEASERNPGRGRAAQRIRPRDYLGEFLNQG
ncbi:hypothetical protein V8C26DRAFT_408665 [Trichoderma gracile]